MSGVAIAKVLSAIDTLKEVPGEVARLEESVKNGARTMKRLRERNDELTKALWRADDQLKKGEVEKARESILKALGAW